MESLLSEKETQAWDSTWALKAALDYLINEVSNEWIEIGQEMGHERLQCEYWAVYILCVTIDRFRCTSSFNFSIQYAMKKYLQCFF